MRKPTPMERSAPAILALALIVPPPLSPAVIVVGGGCSLPDAIAAANSDAASGGCSAGSGADIVRLTGDVTLTSAHLGQSGTPAVTSKITVDGGGFTVARAAGAPDFRLFDIGAAGDLRLEDVVVTGGSVSGVLNGGGAIQNSGVLTVDNGEISVNTADFSGGGIFNGGVATIVNSTISDNQTGEDGGGLYSDFGAVTTVIDSTVSGNYSFWEGSGIFAYEGSYPDAGVTISGSTISGNARSGVVIFYPFSDGALTITNSTISGNGNDGLYVLGGFGVEVESSSLVGNGGDAVDGYTYAAGNLFSNAIFAGSGGADCTLAGLVDGGGNFDSDGTCPGASAITGLDPVLADNGGPTPTHALLPGSSAVDAAGACGLLVDQRGFGRDALCDSGAFELDAAPAVGAEVGGLTPRLARCRNLSTGETAHVAGSTRWNCRAAGLPISSGDRVSQTVRGRPSSPRLTGSVEGILDGRVVCQNLGTGQSVRFVLGGASSWDCRERGLDVSAGDSISWTVVGVAE